MALPTPVLSDGDIVKIEGFSHESARLIWNNWSQDPIKAAVLQAILSCFYASYHSSNFRWVVSRGLGQNRVCLLHCSLSKGEEVHYLSVVRISEKLVTFYGP